VTILRNIDSLKNTSQFKEVYEKGHSAANSFLVLYALATDGDEQKLGISVSKKVGNSVIRHRLSRVIRASFVELREKLPTGYRFVVVARYRAVDKNFSDVCDALLYLSKKMKLI
jgi:ribonuclease P protein component